MTSEKEYGKCFSVEIDIEDIRINVMLDYIFSAGINEITGVAHEHANHEYIMSDVGLYFSNARKTAIHCRKEICSLLVQGLRIL